MTGRQCDGRLIVTSFLHSIFYAAVFAVKYTLQTSVFTKFKIFYFIPLVTFEHQLAILLVCLEVFSFSR